MYKNSNNSLSSISGGSTANLNTDSGNLQNTTNGSQHFQYDDSLLEVVIIDNGEDDRDGYVELLAATKLLSPLVTMRGFNKAVLWTNVIPSQKLTRNNKNYIHVFALGKYISMYNMSTSEPRPAEYYVLKRLISDLLIGVQSNVIDPLADIKTQLCTLQDCISSTGGVVMAGSASGNSEIYQSSSSSSFAVPAPPIQTPINYDFFKDVVCQENAALLSHINTGLESIRNLQMDFINKLAFSNDTMLDNFKSIKDIIIRKK
ncbi:P24 [Perigonia lusca single nucleopolyhedrovirus]|uniref:p24 n=1 Tax=Perigonia lusca single nucleopolyhedrovirus TaxID=1675865 RepID=A0A0M3WNW2_9ABAC|nr:P24 [Perigonia lusca single nucleopolyhedrovirus]AKN80606.1 P24 [Perigonia lusca single nucleopolyhedrovirus]